MDEPAVMLQEESSQLFAQVASLLLEFEKKPADKVLLETIQQAFHSVKVLCTLLALPLAAELARKIDTACGAVLLGDFKVTPTMIDIILASSDQLKEEIEAELENIPLDPEQTQSLLADWNRFLTLLPADRSKSYLKDSPGRIPQQSIGTPRILIIDDEAVSRKLLENMILKFGREVEIISVNSAEEGLFYFLTEQFNLVFLDIIMPVIDGNDFIAIVEKNISIGNLPRRSNIVVQTAAESMEQLLSYIRRSCVQEVIRKPITPDRIADCLERNLFVG